MSAVTVRTYAAYMYAASIVANERGIRVLVVAFISQPCEEAHFIHGLRAKWLCSQGADRLDSCHKRLDPYVTMC